MKSGRAAHRRPVESRQRVVGPHVSSGGVDVSGTRVKGRGGGSRSEGIWALCWASDGCQGAVGPTGGSYPRMRPTGGLWLSVSEGSGRIAWVQTSLSLLFLSFNINPNLLIEFIVFLIYTMYCTPTTAIWSGIYLLFYFNGDREDTRGHITIHVNHQDLPFPSYKKPNTCVSRFNARNSFFKDREVWLSSITSAWPVYRWRVGSNHEPY